MSPQLLQLPDTNITLLSMHYFSLRLSGPRVKIADKIIATDAFLIWNIGISQLLIYYGFCFIILNYSEPQLLEGWAFAFFVYK